MGDINKVFKPRRGKKSTMAGTKKTTILSAGELFAEVPDTGEGSGAGKFKMGDGVTQYGDLPYFAGDTSNDKIEFNTNTSSSVTNALNSVVSGSPLKNLIAGLKQAVSLCNTSITKLNDDITSINKSFQDGCSIIAAKITACGVTTANNASPQTMANNIQTIYDNRYLNGYDECLLNMYNTLVSLGVTPASKDKTTDITAAMSTLATNKYNEGYEAGYAAGRNTGYEEGYTAGASTGLAQYKSVTVKVTGVPSISGHQVTTREITKYIGTKTFTKSGSMSGHASVDGYHSNDTTRPADANCAISATVTFDKA